MAWMKRSHGKHSGLSDVAESADESSAPTSPRTPRGESLAEFLAELLLRYSLPVNELNIMVKELQDEYIVSPDHLRMLQETDVDALNLPVLVKRLLKNSLPEISPKGEKARLLYAAGKASHTRGSPAKSSAHAHKRDESSSPESSLTTATSSSSSSGSSPLANTKGDEEAASKPEQLFANKFSVFTKSQIDVMVGHLKTLTKENFNGVTSSASEFYTQFWSKWIVQDPVAAALHESFSMMQRLKHVTNVLHLIYAVLGSEAVPDDAVDTWESVIKIYGDVQVALYDSVAAGLKFVAYHRQKDKWIKVQAIVQDRQILVLKEGGDLGSNSASSTTIGRGAKDKSKGRDVISLLHYDEVVEVDDDSIAKKTDHCLLLESGKSKVYFCLESKSDLKAMVKALKLRCSTLSRMLKVDAYLPGKFFSAEERKEILDNRAEVDHEPEMVLQSDLSPPSPSSDLPSISPKGSKNKMATSEKGTPRLEKTKSLFGGSKSARSTSKQSKPKELFALLDDVAAPVLVVTIDGEIVYVNPFAALTLEEGVGSRDLVGEKFQDLILTETEHQFREDLRIVIEKKHHSAHVKLKSNTGSKTRLFNVQLNEASSSGDKYIVITLGSKAAKQVQNAQFSRFDDISRSVIAFGENGNVLYANKASSELTGLAPEKVMGNTLSWFLPQSLRTGTVIDWTKLLKGKELELEGQGGAVVHGTLEKEDAGYEQSVYIWREEANTASKMERANFKAAVEFSQDLPIPLVICDATGEILAFNEFAEELFGYQSESVLSESLTTLLPANSGAEDAKAILAEYIKPGAKKSLANTSLKQVQTKDGAIKNVKVSVSEKLIGGKALFFIAFSK